MSEREHEVESADESTDAVEEQNAGQSSSAGAPDEIIEADAPQEPDADEQAQAENDTDEHAEGEDDPAVGGGGGEDAGPSEGGNDQAPDDETAAEQADADDSGELDDLFLSPDDDSEDVIEVDVVGEESSAASDDEDASAALEEAQRAHDEERSRLEARISELEEKLETVQNDRDETRERMLRAAADLENFRKRSKREQEELRKYGIDKLCLELLPAVDNLERALAHAESSEEESDILDGVKMVYKQILSALEKHGVTGFDATGEQFNPEHHEAIQQVESQEHETGEVVDQFQKGYIIHERLLRPALVSVAKRVDGGDNDEQSREDKQDEEMNEESGESDSQQEEAVASDEGSED